MLAVVTNPRTAEELLRNLGLLACQARERCPPMASCSLPDNIFYGT